jgi:hypothetical protein
MAVLRYVAGGGDTRFDERSLVARIRQQVHCSRDHVWAALWGLVGEGLI